MSLSSHQAKHLFLPGTLSLRRFLLFQAKLAIGRSDDPYEAEADRLADQALRRSLTIHPLSPPPMITQLAADAPAVRRKCDHCFEEAIAREPSSFRSRVGRGLILTGFEDLLDEALHEFDVAIKLGADGAVIHGYRAIVLANQNKYHDAIVACREAIALGNTNVPAFNSVAALMPAAPRRRLLDILRTTLGKRKAE
jgi:hypothetical protein